MCSRLNLNRIEVSTLCSKGLKKIEMKLYNNKRVFAKKSAVIAIGFIYIKYTSPGEETAPVLPYPLERRRHRCSHIPWRGDGTGAPILIFKTSTTLLH